MEKQQKMKMEALASGDFPLAMKRLDQQIKKVKEAEAEVTKDPNEINKTKLANAQQALQDMYTVNVGRHAAFGEAARSAIIAEFGLQTDTSLDLDQSPQGIQSTKQNLYTLQAQELGLMLGEKVNLDFTKSFQDGAIVPLQNAMAKLEQRYLEKYKEQGPDEAKARMDSDLRLRMDYNSQAAGQGSIGLAGLWESYFDNNAKKFKTRLTDLTNDKSIGYVASRRQAGMAGSNIVNLDGGFGGSLDHAARKDSQGNVVGVTPVLKSDYSIDTAIKIISPLTVQQLPRLNEYSKEEIAGILENTDVSTLKKFLNGLSTTMAKRDDKIFPALMDEAQKRLSAGAKDPKNTESYQMSNESSPGNYTREKIVSDLVEQAAQYGAAARKANSQRGGQKNKNPKGDDTFSKGGGI